MVDVVWSNNKQYPCDQDRPSRISLPFHALFSFELLSNMFRVKKRRLLKVCTSRGKLSETRCQEFQFNGIKKTSSLLLSCLSLLLHNTYILDLVYLKQNGSHSRRLSANAFFLVAHYSVGVRKYLKFPSVFLLLRANYKKGPRTLRMYEVGCGLAWTCCNEWQLWSF